MRGGCQKRGSIVVERGGVPKKAKVNKCWAC